MTYNVMAINPGHNGSVALVCDGKLEYYIEEERLSRSKYDGNPYRGMIYLIDRYKIDELLMCGTGQEEHRLPWTGEISYGALVRKYYPHQSYQLFFQSNLPHILEFLSVLSTQDSLQHLVT